jgi:hypothetical protein
MSLCLTARCSSASVYYPVYTCPTASLSHTTRAYIRESSMRIEREKERENDNRMQSRIENSKSEAAAQVNSYYIQRQSEGEMLCNRIDRSLAPCGVNDIIKYKWRATWHTHYWQNLMQKLGFVPVICVARNSFHQDRLYSDYPFVIFEEIKFIRYTFNKSDCHR